MVGLTASYNRLCIQGSLLILLIARFKLFACLLDERFMKLGYEALSLSKYVTISLRCAIDCYH